MVLRTKPTETESEAETMAKAMEQQLGQKLVTMVLKQRYATQIILFHIQTDKHCDIRLYVFANCVCE